MRSSRLGGANESNIQIFCETLIDNVIAEAVESRPDLVIVDSVQTMYTSGIESVRKRFPSKKVAAMLLRFAKETGIPVILIGHITRDGYIAGPKFWSI